MSFSCCLVQCVGWVIFGKVYKFVCLLVFTAVLNVSSSQTKIDKKFANYNKCLLVLKCRCKGLQKRHKWTRALKSKRKALQHFKADPVLKLDETVYKQAESMNVQTAEPIRTVVAMKLTWLTKKLKRKKGKKCKFVQIFEVH